MIIISKMGSSTIVSKLSLEPFDPLYGWYWRSFNQDYVAKA
jgi:hypothetical protein